MRLKILLFLLLLVFYSGCKKEDSPVEGSSGPATTGVIIGNITSFETGNPVSQVTITTSPATNSITTDIYGDYILENIKPGSYTITAYKSNFDSTSTKIVVTEGINTRADMTIKPAKIITPGRLRGVVINAANDSVISDANVYTSTKPFYSTKTNSSGVYDLTGIRPGDYDVTVEKFGFSTKVIKISVISDSVQTINFSLQPLYGRITGRITDAVTNAGIPGVNITTTPPTNSVSTDASGNYIMENLPKGTYKLATLKDGYVPGSIQVNVIEGKAAIGDVIMTKK